MEHKMPEEKDSSSMSNEDLGKSSISHTPCGICRASGLPICKGHGGGSSGGGSGDSDSKEATQKQPGSQTSSGSVHLDIPMPKPKNDALFDLLEHSPLWTQTGDFVFEYQNPHALLSMTLNMENNRLCCQGREDLTEEEQHHALDTLFKAVEYELNRFKEESSTTYPIEANISRVGNQMTIDIPDPKYFDAFIQRLVDKNLLVLADKNLLRSHSEAEPMAPMTISEVEAPQSEQSASSGAAPTPFDLTPKPKG
jgi:hypothetical protein